MPSRQISNRDSLTATTLCAPWPPSIWTGRRTASPQSSTLPSETGSPASGRLGTGDHPFPSKQHLREHTSAPPDSRPYSCRLCRKVYKRRGSLSAHVRLHHGDSRPRKLGCCELCAKVFGHVRVYFGHLKEVHGVAISTEPSPCEPQPGDLPRTPCEVEGLVER